MSIEKRIERLESSSNAPINIGATLAAVRAGTYTPSGACCEVGCLATANDSTSQILFGARARLGIGCKCFSGQGGRNDR